MNALEDAIILLIEKLDEIESTIRYAKDAASTSEARANAFSEEAKKKHQYIEALLRQRQGLEAAVEHLKRPML